MNYLLIGQSVEDHIYDLGDEVIKPGGIFYSASALNQLIRKDDNIHLCTSMQKDKLNLFSPLYNNINRKYFIFVNEIPRINLTLHKDRERDESYQNLSLEIEINIKDFSGYSGILINMITGFDISLITLKRIRKSFSGIIYMDVHSLARKENSDSNIREHSLIDNFGEWAECLDIIQVNQNELYSLSMKKDEMEIVNEVLTREGQYLAVTKEDKGAVLYYKDNGRLLNICEPGLKIKVNNTIGCGDVFGAAFFYFYTKDKDASRALKYAVRASGLMVSYDNFKQLENLRKDVLSPIS